jgi:hypothetical protein
MKISKDNAERLRQIALDMVELLSEFKQIARSSMSSHEYEQFKYRTLGHLEPGLIEDSEWVTSYSAIDSLEKVAENAGEELICPECGSELNEDGTCSDEDCDYKPENEES